MRTRASGRSGRRVIEDALGSRLALGSKVDFPAKAVGIEWPAEAFGRIDASLPGPVLNG